ncbi:hypothetical protein J3F84DRAFT_31270 [Trichoderma pleuroticola]
MRKPHRFLAHFGTRPLGSGRAMGMGMVMIGGEAPEYFVVVFLSLFLFPLQLVCSPPAKLPLHHQWQETLSTYTLYSNIIKRLAPWDRQVRAAPFSWAGLVPGK